MIYSRCECLRNAYRNEKEKYLSVIGVELFVKHVLLNLAVKFKFQNTCKVK